MNGPQLMGEIAMIKVLRVSGETMWLNEHYIETIEATPDTIIKIREGTTFAVQETPEAVVRSIDAWRKGKIEAEGQA